MKMITSIHAVILHTTPYKENDMIIHTYSLDYGKLSFIAKGVKKMTSKNAKGIHLMSLSNLEVNITNTLGTLIRAEAENYYRHIGENIVSDAVGQYILEYYYRYESENTPDADKYDVLVTSLEALNNGYDPLTVLALFQSFVLRSNGIGVNVDACKVCGNKHVVGISHIDGSFVCSQHVEHNTYKVETLKFYRRLFKLDIHHIDELSLEGVEIRELIKILSGLLNEYSGMQFNAMKFIEKLM